MVDTFQLLFTRIAFPAAHRSHSRRGWILGSRTIPISGWIRANLSKSACACMSYVRCELWWWGMNYRANRSPADDEDWKGIKWNCDGGRLSSVNERTRLVSRNDDSVGEKENSHTSPHFCHCFHCEFVLSLARWCCWGANQLTDRHSARTHILPLLPLIEILDVSLDFLFD